MSELNLEAQKAETEKVEKIKVALDRILNKKCCL